MAGPKLSVELLARVKNWVKNLNTAYKSTKKTQGAVEDLTSATTKFNARVGKSKTLKQVSADFKKTGRNSAEASASVIEFSRALQDAPYGIQGVANNIQQLSANFANLIKKTGSAGAAFKAFGAGLFTGGGALVLGITLATLAIQLLGSSFKKAEDKAKSLQKRLEKLNKVFSTELSINDELIKQQELEEKSAKKLLELRKDILKNQLKAVDAVLLQQAELLKNQQILNSTVSNWEIIIGAAKFLAATPLPIIKKLWGDIESIQNRVADFELGLFGLKREDFQQFAATKKDLEKQSQIQQQLKEIELQRLQIKSKILGVDKKITKEIEDQQKFYTAPSGGPIDIPEGAFGVTPDALEKLEDFTAQAGKALRNLRKESTKTIPAVVVLTTRLEDLLEAFKGDAFNLQIQGLVSGIASIGDSIGQAIVSGGNIISTFAASLLSAFGGFISQLGQLLIEYGALAVAKGTLDTALATLFGPALVGAGLAAIGIGLALTVAGGALSSFGGKALSSQGVQSGVSGSGSFSGSNTFSGGGGGFSGGEVVFRIQGSTLVGVLNNTLDNNARLGGSTTIG